MLVVGIVVTIHVVGSLALPFLLCVNENAVFLLTFITGFLFVFMIFLLVW